MIHVFNQLDGKDLALKGPQFSVCRCCFAVVTVDPTVKPRALTEDLWSLIRS